MGLFEISNGPTKDQLVLARLTVDRQGQGIGCPACRHGRDPLIVPVREAALKILLKFRGAAGDVPGAIRALCAEQELYALCHPAASRRLH